MPATATQKKAFFQWRCTKGESLWANCGFGAFISVSLGLKFCIGTPTRPLRAAVATTGLNTGSFPALPSLMCDPPPLTSTGEMPFLSRGLVVTSLGVSFLTRSRLLLDLLHALHVPEHVRLLGRGLGD